MLYILTGNNNREKELYIQQLAGKKPSTQILEVEPENLIDLASQTDLFAPNRLLVVRESIKNLAEITEGLANAVDDIIIFEPKLTPLDKTLAAISKQKHVKLVNLTVPTGKDLAVWIEGYVNKKGGSILPDANSFLINILGLNFQTKEGPEDFALDRVASELDKLCVYAGTKAITKEMVKELVTEIPQSAAFEILNAMAANNKILLIKLLDDFYASSPGDEKASTILLSGLIAEQLRGIALVLAAGQEGMGEPQILEQTGWKPGRLFMVKKIAKFFDLKNVLSSLNKLEHLDNEMKSSTLSGRLLFGMIFVGLIK